MNSTYRLLAWSSGFWGIKKKKNLYDVPVSHLLHVVQVFSIICGSQDSSRKTMCMNSLALQAHRVACNLDILILRGPPLWSVQICLFRAFETKALTDNLKVISGMEAEVAQKVKSVWLFGPSITVILSPSGSYLVLFFASEPQISQTHICWVSCPLGWAYVHLRPFLHDGGHGPRSCRWTLESKASLRTDHLHSITSIHVLPVNVACCVCGYCIQPEDMPCPPPHHDG